jgi:beta-xylosidase
VDIESGTIELSFELSNIGNRFGVEVPQLYVRDRHTSVVRPVKELKGFQRVALSAGESAHVTFAVPVDMLSLTDHSGERVVEPGWFDLMVGSSSSQIRLREAVEVVGKGSRVLPRIWRMESSSSLRRA